MRVKKSFENKSMDSGFSIVELIVVIAVFLVLSGVSLIRFSLFNNTILTTNLAYEVALTIRQAQTFGLNVRESGLGTGQFDIGYGVHFESASDDQFVFFADLNKNRRFDSGETIEILTIRAGNSIEKFCGINSGAETCSPGSIDNLDIVFERPNPDAHIKSFDPEVAYEAGKIYLTSNQGVRRVIITRNTGQISIQTP